MKVLILGADGYLGWPTAMYLSQQGHDVFLLDSMIKRSWEAQVGVEPLTPIHTLASRVKLWTKLTGKELKIYVGDIASNERFAYKVIEDCQPDCIIHYAEQPSAPFSMISRSKAVETQRNNVLGTLNVIFALQSINPAIHLIKLGTMGEYGTPNIDIEEGWLDVEHNGRKDRVLYPKRPPSFYHLSKVHDSANLEFVCRSWGLRVTDLNQGIVYGIETEETKLHPELATSFHYDSVFGTVLNRFVVQAVVGHPLTVYGKGEQKRGMLNINDTLKCVELAMNNPAEPSEFRVFNQFTQSFSINELANIVQRVGNARGLNVEIKSVDNPRTESDDHYFNAKHTKLPQLGLDPILLSDALVDSMFGVVIENQANIDNSFILPSVKWNQRK